MIQSLLKAIIGTKNQRDLKRLQPQVMRINALEEEYQSLSEEQLRAKTDEFRRRIEGGETVEDLLCEAFAVVKNACRRLCGREIDVCGHIHIWDMVPFDVQLIGGIVLHQGKIAEMATGEGKTLVATMPVYLNALGGGNVHVVTVNDYLARRDAAWMGQVYAYLGLTVGCIQNQMSPDERRQQYACDITYGTNSEFGFDYLRDNGMAMRPQECVQRGYHYAIIDEIDSILIDEARTPLIISGPAPKSTHQYDRLKPAVERLVRKQRELCNRMVHEARQALDNEDPEEQERGELLLYQVKQGMPKNKQFLHMLEDPAVRKRLERIDSAMLTDMRKEQARALREEMYFTIDERGHDASLTERGCETLNPEDPEMYVLPDIASSLSELEGDENLDPDEKLERRRRIQDEYTERSERIHNVDQLIRAYCVYERDNEYVVQNNQVMIVDEFTGRLMPGRRWSDGLHQAIEAKEGVQIERETQTLATITIQNYFRMYDKLSGMTGTAETEADEFSQIYDLDVVVIPTNRPVRRVDYNDLIFKTQREKYNAIIAEVEQCHRNGQPVLLGTVSVDTSEVLSRMLKRRNVPHNVLNAKKHESEAEVVARAGQAGAVTIATNMAGRGTDIKLGEGVVKLPREVVLSGTRLEDRYDGKTLKQVLVEKPGGLHVIGSERHESRRIDRQLRGRCARQGDPGSSRFYVSLEDDLMRLFGSERVSGIMERLGLEEGQVLEHRWLNRSIETAQRRVEQQNFAIRKRTLEYDDVMNAQRNVIYGFRSEIVTSDEVRPLLYEICEDVVRTRAEALVRLDDDEAEEPCAEFLDWLHETFPIALQAGELRSSRNDADAVTDMIMERVRNAYETKVGLEDQDALHSMERFIMLRPVDTHWQEYLRGMDELRQGVGLRAYGQRDPLVEYKREAYEMFSDLMDRIREDIVVGMFRSSTSLESMNAFLRNLPRQLVHDAAGAMARQRAGEGEEEAMESALGNGSRQQPVMRDAPKVGRNDPCPCGSGRKFKKCCGSQ